MKTFAAVLASLCIALPPVSAHAHGDHKPTHGGDMGRGSDDVIVEFVMDQGTLKLYVADDSGNPLEADKLQGTLTVVAAHGSPQEVKLIPSGPHQLAARGAVPHRGDRLHALIKLPSGEVVESVTLFSH